MFSSSPARQTAQARPGKLEAPTLIAEPQRPTGIVLECRTNPLSAPQKSHKLEPNQVERYKAIQLIPFCTNGPTSSLPPYPRLPLPLNKRGSSSKRHSYEVNCGQA